MWPHLLQDPGQSSNCPVLASLIKEQVYVYVYGRATQLASMIKEQVYVYVYGRATQLASLMKEQVYVYVYVRGAAWWQCDSENQAFYRWPCIVYL